MQFCVEDKFGASDRWADIVEFCISLEKTDLVILTNMINVDLRNTLELGGTNLILKDLTKYLGTYSDFKEHECSL